MKISRDTTELPALLRIRYLGEVDGSSRLRLKNHCTINGASPSTWHRSVTVWPKFTGLPLISSSRLTLGGTAWYKGKQRNKNHAASAGHQYSIYWAHRDGQLKRTFSSEVLQLWHCFMSQAPQQYKLMHGLPVTQLLDVSEPV